MKPLQQKRAQATYSLKEIADDAQRRIADWQRKQVAAGEKHLAELKNLKIIELQ